VCAFVLLCCLPQPALAYIGPGAGFALGGSFLFGLIGLLMAVGALLLWPVRFAIRAFRSRRRRGKSRARRVVVLGLDGLDPGIASKLMQAGELPNLRRLRDTGGFRPLTTTLPAMSPVGWSTFATGVDASGHNIFDFLSRDTRTHMPVLSSTRISSSGTMRRIGSWVIKRPRAIIELLRKSKPFWKVLAENGVPSTILRVPITFPPDKYNGRMLSAMCVPDLRGTQGTFSHYTAPHGGNGDGGAGNDGDNSGNENLRSGETTGGVRLTLVERGPGSFAGELIGPDLPGADGTNRTSELPFTVAVDATARQARFRVAGESFTIGEHEYSPWVKVAFGKGRETAHGICRFRITSFDDPFSCYVSPINIDPEHPAMPISNPPHFAIALAKLHGSYATLGLAEDTWALNERVLDEQAFLDQAYAIQEERKQQFFHALDRSPDGVVSVVFDATDRIQHMFFRYFDADHPANRGKDTERHRDAIPDLYRRADGIVGETSARLGEQDVLLVISDHGFATFQRGVNLNAWFRENGYLYLKDDPAEGPLPSLNGAKYEPAQIDWPRTRAYTNGLAGFYLNIDGREHDGCVPPDEAPALKQELIGKLRGLPDAERDAEAIRDLWDGAEYYQGPYRGNGPDVLVGYNRGYRADWDGAVGRVTGQTIGDNTRSWSGDHCMDPGQVPGVLFANRSFGNQDPALVDIAPSVLDLFGIDRPPYMSGRSIFR